MLKLVMAVSLIFPMTVFANVISFQCHSVDLPGVHMFDATGVVTVDSSDKVEGVAFVSVQKAQSIQSVQTFSEVRVNGYIRHFAAGEVTSKAFDQLVLKTNEPYLKTLNLLLGFDEKIASRILSIDNFSYRSNCKITETFN